MSNDTKIKQRGCTMPSQMICLTEEEFISTETGKLSVSITARWDVGSAKTIGINMESDGGPWVNNNTAVVVADMAYYRINKTSMTRQVIDKFLSDYLDNYMPMFFKKDKG